MAERYDVVLVVPSLGRSGGLRVLVEWAARLAATGQRVAVATAASGPGAAMAGSADIVAPGKLRHLLDEAALRILRPRRASLADLQVYPRTVRSRLPAADRYVLGFAPWGPALDLDGEVLTYCQHWEPLWFPDSQPAAAIAERAMHAPGPKVVNSTWLRGHWPASAQSELHLVHPGVDLEVYRPPQRPRQRAAGQPLRVAALGRADVRWKGLAELRQALDQAGVPVELVLFGTPGRGTVRRSWGTETAVGGLSPEELAAVFGSVDVVVTASWFESFPLPPLEAMACAAAVLTTREGTEDYAIDRVNALVVPGRDAAALAGGIAELAGDGDLRAALAAAGPQTAARFTWSAGFAAFQRCLDETAS